MDLLAQHVSYIRTGHNTYPPDPVPPSGHPRKEGTPLGPSKTVAPEVDTTCDGIRSGDLSHDKADNE